MKEQFGKYVLTRKLAVGGMAEVFLAAQKGLGGFTKQLAIKRMLEHLTEEPGFTTLFLDEGRLVAQLNHPNIVQVFDLGVIAGRYYMAMELVDGCSLSRLMRACANGGQRLPQDLSTHIIRQTCLGLEYAHKFRGEDGKPLHLIHRDISPQNLMISYEGALKIVDFGIAKAVSNLHFTNPMTLRGKIAYMSPEQIVDDTPLDHRSDIYSLGVVFFELLSGRRPHEADSDVRLMTRIVQQDAADLRELAPSVPDDLAVIVQQMLAKDPAQRPEDCRELHHRLDKYLIRQGEHVGDYELADFLHSLIPKEDSPLRLQERASPALLPRASEENPAPVAVTEPEGDERDVRPVFAWLILLAGVVATGGLVFWLAAEEPQATAGPGEMQQLADSAPFAGSPELAMRRSLTHHMDKTAALMEDDSKLPLARAHLEEALGISGKLVLTSQEQRQLKELRSRLDRRQVALNKKQQEEWQRSYGDHLIKGMNLSRNKGRLDEAESHLAAALDLADLAGASQEERSRLRQKLDELRHRAKELSSHERRASSKAKKRFLKAAMRYCQIAHKRFHKKNYRGALTYFKKALDHNPTSRELHYWIARCQDKLGKRDAISNYRIYINNCGVCTYRSEAEDRLAALMGKP